MWEEFQYKSRHVLPTTAFFDAPTAQAALLHVAYQSAIYLHHTHRVAGMYTVVHKNTPLNFLMFLCQIFFINFSQHCSNCSSGCAFCEDLTSRWICDNILWKHIWPQHTNWTMFSIVQCLNVEWMNEWKCNDLKCVRKPTKSRLSLTHHANKSSRWAE